MLAIWRTYLEILNERIFLVDRWSDGIATWHPRVVQKLCWCSGIPATKRNLNAAYRWLVKNCTKLAIRNVPAI